MRRGTLRVAGLADLPPAVRERLGKANVKLLSVSPNKYHAEKAHADGITFDSKHERERYMLLRDKEKRGEIQNLRVHVPIPVEINDQLVCTYVCDMVYDDNGVTIYEDCKGLRRGLPYQHFRLKAKLVEVTRGIKVDVV